MSGLGLLNDNQSAALLLAAALIVVAGYLLGRESRRPYSSRRRLFWAPSQKFRSGHDQVADLTDPGQQLNAVMAANFQKQPLLNKSEYRVFKVIESEVAAARRGYRVFAQTCLGEVLKSSNQNAYRSINSKRVDMLIVDPFGWPVLAVEYQGSGHYLGTAAARDAIKREALRRAGVQYLEVSSDDDDDSIRINVRAKLGWNATSNSNWRDSVQSAEAKTVIEA